MEAKNYERQFPDKWYGERSGRDLPPLRERFAPMACFGGPLYAGIYTREGISGGLYVGQQNKWLWVPETVGRHSPEDAFVSDEQVAAARDLAVTLESLLRSAKLVFELFLEHLGRIQPEPTFKDLVKTYLTDSVALVVDAVALRGRGEMNAVRK